MTKLQLLDLDGRLLLEVLCPLGQTKFVNLKPSLSPASLAVINTAQEAKPEGEAACGNCRFWQKTVYFEEGECRKRAPTGTNRNSQHSEFSPAYPATHEGDWCGDHMRKEDR